MIRVIMTTDTEALRERFEETLASIFGSRPYVLDCRLDNGAYAAKDFQMAWLCYQAGHAAAKAETADVVAKEREHCALVCEDVRRAVAEINGSGVAAAQQCADAIRAGAKERGE